MKGTFSIDHPRALAGKYLPNTNSLAGAIAEIFAEVCDGEVIIYTDMALIVDGVVHYIDGEFIIDDGLDPRIRIKELLAAFQCEYSSDIDIEVEVP